MSLFSRLKRRVRAKEKNSKNEEKVSEKAKEEPAKVPYKHVVTHAACDMLLVAPASAREADKARIIELNMRNIALERSERKAAGMPRGQDSLSIHKTPAFPLPNNYKPYSADDRWFNPRYYPPELVGSQKGPNNLNRPESLRSGKGKEPEYIRSPSSIPPVPRLPVGQFGITSSHGAPLDETSVVSSTSNVEPRINNKAINRLSQNSSYEPSLSQKSISFSEKSYQTPLTGTSLITIGAPVKSDRYYPPSTKSAYFSASHTANQRTENQLSKLENKNISGTEIAIPPIPAVPQKVNKSTPPASSFNESSIKSIGPAIAPPRPPCIVAPPPVPCSTEEATGLEHTTSKTITASGPCAKTPQKSSVEKGKAPADTTVNDLEEQNAAVPSTSSPQMKARRLSKSRPSSSGNGKSRLSIDASQRSRSNSTAPGATASELDRASHTAEPKTSETSKGSSEPTLKTGKLRKKPKEKRQRRKWWTFGWRSTTEVH
ncbi:hypothetical protein F5Y00DRAFT_273217 [Daldinia vernicosa]|uniref:uncharacterized protein n=1 Tax=Daldinia vernicosa TaxID=114800 RepID=UPI002008B91B|nr:uncharacterized protein F5Y00DRAFT_273217 [Daldinia vernicosa]KAI0852696.1 hypothetical protein F5Y00DRAFT_273217 [Daldinia vernicosa]